jgi:protein-disulfide isomerase
MFQLYSRIPQNGAKLGSPGAPYRMIEYVDLQCPFCAQYSIYVLPPMLRRYVRTRRVQLEMRPIAALGKDSAVAARALLAAGEEDRMWQFADLFYRNQGQENSGYVTPELLRTISRQGSLSPSTILAAARSPIQPPALLKNVKSAKRFRVTGTPTFLLGRRGGPLQRLKVSKLEGPPFLADLDAALKRL